MNSPSSATNTPDQFPTSPRTTGGEVLIREAFNDIALVIGGVAVLHNLDDDLTWTLMKRLDRIRVRLLRDLKGAVQRNDFEPTIAIPPRVHAAAEEFLLRNRAEIAE